MSSYEDHGVFTRSIRLGGRERVMTSPLSLKFSKPNRIVLDAGEVRLIGDGKTLTTVLTPTKRYLVTPLPGKLDVTTVADGSAGAILLGGASGPPSQLLLKLVLGVEPALALPDRATSVRIDEDRNRDGKTYPSLRIEQGDEPPLRILIDPETHLIRRMEYVLDPKGLAERVPSEGAIEEMNLAWDSGVITSSDLPAEAFAFTAPAGFQRIKAAEAKPVAAAGAKVPGAAPKNEFIGQVAPDFTVTVLDGPGKTKKISRAELAGKVVLIDFWATWCPPCLMELPEIQKLADAYSKAGKTNVVVLLVSQDREPEDGSAVRKLVEDLLETKFPDLSKGKLIRVALDPDQAIGDVFKVQALPTVVILDTKGVVQSVHVGFHEDVKEVLTTEIDALLDGKAPPIPKRDPAANKGDQPKP